MLPARLKQIRRSDEAIIAERSSNSSHIFLISARDDEVINLGGQIRKTAIVDERT